MQNARVVFDSPKGIIITPSQNTQPLLKNTFPLDSFSHLNSSMNATDRQHFAPLFQNRHNLRGRDFHHRDQGYTMALRNYMLNLVSDLAETNETSVGKMSVTIVSDNTIPSVWSDSSIALTGSSDSTSEEENSKPPAMALEAKGTPSFGRVDFWVAFQESKAPTKV
mmetsp:Transcript_16932/g.34953  ORF Transcript_16932/g.34953 Transcript_16932/m.34953 type:complete len:166 (-) Transcript_16932:170-667(-)